MSRFHSYLNSAKSILLAYNGTEPFSSYLKKWFAAEKKFGSKDRKYIEQFCYSYFRTAKLRSCKPDENSILTGLFLCAISPDEILTELKPEWSPHTGLTLHEKLKLLNYDLASVFPWQEELSEGTDYESFCASFFARPDVFLRLRDDGCGAIVKDKLQQKNIFFKEVTENCLALPSASKISEVLALDYEAMIQDLNSQRTGEFMRIAAESLHLPFISVWDCCAGSGGKSLLMYDIYQQMDLTVSDSRESILRNLKKRFSAHGIPKYEIVLADLSKRPAKFRGDAKFNLIICDAPCTGSGTWGRTPEQLCYFNNDSIEYYANLQKKVVSNTVTCLTPGGFFLYITCSVFKKENEEIVSFIKEQFHLQLVKMELLKGYDNLSEGKAGKADTMFAALLKKSL
ncbi:MAG: Fmu (Sun) domain-containing protein [Bacteroidetes bacterium]|nr:Fmu (Sun) domain-containing protein [Bacteroidota bacterium]